MGGGLDPGVEGPEGAVLQPNEPQLRGAGPGQGQLILDDSSPQTSGGGPSQVAGGDSGKDTHRNRRVKDPPCDPRSRPACKVDHYPRTWPSGHTRCSQWADYAGRGRSVLAQMQPLAPGGAPDNSFYHIRSRNSHNGRRQTSEKLTIPPDDGLAELHRTLHGMGIHDSCRA